MRRWPPLILVTLAVLAIPSAFAATKTVDVTRAGFTPSKVTVDFGDTVTWTNKDNQSHQVLFDQAPRSIRRRQVTLRTAGRDDRPARLCQPLRHG